MPTPNDKLRAARERTSSPDHPTEGLTRQEVADLANAWLWERHKKKFVLTSGYIGKLEQGIIRWPSALYREAFREIFKVPKDSALGFINARSRRAAVKLENVKRRQLFETGGVGVGALALEELLESSEPPPIPHRVGAADIEQIRRATQEFDSWSRTYGGGVVRGAIMGQLRYSAGLLKATCPDQLRPELFSAVGNLADVAGYLAYDADAQEEARQVCRFALGCAEQAKDWNLRADVLSSMAKQEIWTGQPDEGLTLAELALVRPDRIKATLRALLHTSRALALAKMRRVQETLTAVGTADEHFTQITADDLPSLYTAALVDLAMLGRHPKQADDLLTAAAAGHVRLRATCLAKLASLTMATGDPLHAVAIGNEAVEVAGSIRSHRAAEALRELSRCAVRHQGLEEVAHLRQRIGALLVPTDSPSP